MELSLDSAQACDHALFERLEFIRNFAQRLKSTPEAEDSTDWLSPHRNDDNEWILNYGAAIAVQNAQGVVIREIGVRQGQNGILLSRVINSQIYNCDASFLSGWGIGLWRSSSNTICRNALDFCVRGYSHTIYNRGQDSAGILCFEQSSDNTIMLNSATHCGDGFFGFAGREALGETPGPSATTPQGAAWPAAWPAAWHHGRGCNRNLIALNDFSDAAAHGLELTFSFDNRILRNRFDRDAICGVWAGYSQRTDIRGNVFRANGDAGYGAENGAINIEHGKGSMIVENKFSTNSAGVRLWWDEDAHLASHAWTKANGGDSTDNTIVGNTFANDAIGIFLRASPKTVISDNTMDRVAVPLDTDEQSRPLSAAQTTNATIAPLNWTELQAIADKLPGAGNAVDIVDGMPISKRNPLAGRAAIAIGQFGPYDFVAPMAIAEPSPTNVNRWKLLGSQPILFLQASQGQGDLRTGMDVETNTATIETETPGQLTNYELAIFWGRNPDQVQRVRGTLLSADWRVSIFPLPTPSTPGGLPDPETFEKAAKDAYLVYVESLSFRFGSGGPDVAKLMPTGPNVPKDNFGLIATTTFQAAPGDWIVQTKSDDGIRVMFDGKMIIDHWDRHATAIDQWRFSIQQAKAVTMSVHYFELDGDARLDLRILPDPNAPKRPEVAP